MNAALIDRLTACELKDTSSSMVAAHGQGSAIQARAFARFASRYTNTAFGWEIARRFAHRRARFPITMMGKDYWVFRAYLMQIDCIRWHNDSVMEALALSTLDGLRQIGHNLKGMLLSGCGRDQQEHYHALSEITGINKSTLEAFEVLFYNVLDRQEDALYVANEVYPNTRVCEFSEDYLKQTDVADLIKRAGYNYRDLQLTAYLAGIGDRSYMAKLAARTDREQELTKQFMGNALVMSQTGLLNQRSVGFSRTTAMLAASRGAGKVEEAPAVSGVGDMVANELAAALSANYEQMRSILREDAGATIEAEVVSLA